MSVFEVTSSHAHAVFKDENDAINALWLIGFYHDFNIDYKAVKQALDDKNYYEKFPICIVKADV